MKKMSEQEVVVQFGLVDDGRNYYMKSNVRERTAFVAGCLISERRASRVYDYAQSRSSPIEVSELRSMFTSTTTIAISAVPGVEIGFHSSITASATAWICKY